VARLDHHVPEIEKTAQEAIKQNVRLYNYWANDETMTDLKMRGNDSEQKMWVASDGSVLDSHTRGTWAWVLLEYCTKEE
jgi:hypothetical protein